MKRNEILDEIIETEKRYSGCECGIKPKNHVHREFKAYVVREGDNLEKPAKLYFIKTKGRKQLKR